MTDLDLLKSTMKLLVCSYFIRNEITFLNSEISLGGKYDAIIDEACGIEFVSPLSSPRQTKTPTVDDHMTGNTSEHHSVPSSSVSLMEPIERYKQLIPHIRRILNKNGVNFWNLTFFLNLKYFSFRRCGS